MQEQYGITMAKIKYTLVTHIFDGPRFANHGVDVDALADLLAFKETLVETAKELWRRSNPSRQRLPRNFEASLQLKFYEVKSGSAAIPLEREVDQEDSLFPSAHTPDELDRAVELVASALRNVASDKCLPSGFPASVLPYLAKCGRTLETGERIVIRSDGPSSEATITTEDRDFLTSLVSGEYVDSVELEGEIRAADLDGRSFYLRLDDGSRVAGSFTGEQEDDITSALKNHEVTRLRLRSTARFYPSGLIKRVEPAESLVVLHSGQETIPIACPAIWDVAAAISQKVPLDVWRKVPQDLSANLDAYIYDSDHP
jgi:hypothetical protein